MKKVIPPIKEILKENLDHINISIKDPSETVSLPLYEYECGCIYQHPPMKRNSFSTCPEHHTTIKYKISICKFCLSPFKTVFRTGTKSVCPPCSEKQINEYKKEYYRTHKRYRINGKSTPAVKYRDCIWYLDCLSLKGNPKSGRLLKKKNACLNCKDFKLMTEEDKIRNYHKFH